MVTRGRICGALLWLAGLTNGLLAPIAWAAPRVPQDDAVVLERLPFKAADPVARDLRELRAKLAADPQDQNTAVRLARRYFRLAMAEGDPRYIGYAEAALAPWRAAKEGPAELMVIRALLRQYRHDFDGALTDLAAAAKADRRNVEIWRWRAAIHLVRADYPAASGACEALREVSDELDWLGCKASVDGMTGGAKAAYDALAPALARDAAGSPSGKLWVLTRLAELAQRSGDAARAERHFKEALALDVDDQYLLAAYADLLLDEQRPEAVVQLLKNWARSDTLLLRLALAERAVGLRTASERVRALRARFDAAALRGDRLHQQEEARFRLHLLGETDRALALARENWTHQREPRDVRILLEAALQAGDRDAAKPALDWLAASGHEDPVIRRLAAQLGAK
jgi:predicted Zn-dependent protease